jgi:CelD/BcsL family acetyltransferase involved in cellulose biosynthesis
VPLELWIGEAADELLASSWLRPEWERLYAECPWATVFQAYGYAATWYATYRPRFRALLVGATDADGHLDGLLPLAIPPSGDVIGAGARQAEYQVWLARPDNGDAFIEAALERLAEELPHRALTLRYVPPGAPRAWLATGQRIARRTVRRAVPRPIWQIGDASAIEASLRKPRNRARLARLEDVGPVSYERLTQPATIDALLDEIIPLCDFRHGSVHGVMPFGDDPLKARFHRALAREPGLLYVSVLRCGREVACAGFDADNRGQVALGFAAFSPFLSRHSPRRIQLLSLAHDLARRGYSSIDLTPGRDPFKNEWATCFDEVDTLRVFFSAPRFAIRTTVSAAQRAAKAALARTGADPTHLGERLRQWAEALRPGGALRALWSSEAVDLYEFSAPTSESLPTVQPMHRDRIPELIAYRPGLFARESRRDFLRAALKRLEHDAHVFTRVDDGELVACGWVSGSPALDGGAELRRVMGDPPDSAFVHDVATITRLSTPAELASVLAQLVRGAAGLPGVARVIVAAPASNASIGRAAEALGGRYVGSVYSRTRVGRTRVRSTLRGGQILSAPPHPSDTQAQGH